MKTIAVLMSTYNGELYLREQIDSILAQIDVEPILIVRDDGSSDSTISILQEYAKSNDNIILLLETNCGAEESFNKLCQYALTHLSTDYYAFCDQDDVWDSDKLKIAIDALEKYHLDSPNLYFSNLRMVNENLEFIRDFYLPEEVFVNRSKTLVQIFTYGCTCVFNRKALEYYCKVENRTFHDNWIYVICSYLGNVIYDSDTHIQYRQHCNNLSGHQKKGISLIIKRIKRLFKGNLGHDFEVMAQQLLFFKEHLEKEDFRLILKVATYRTDILSRLYLLFSSSYTTRGLFKNIAVRIRIIIGNL